MVCCPRLTIPAHTQWGPTEALPDQPKKVRVSNPVRFPMCMLATVAPPPRSESVPAAVLGSCRRVVDGLNLRGSSSLEQEPLIPSSAPPGEWKGPCQALSTVGWYQTPPAIWECSGWGGQSSCLWGSPREGGGEAGVA